MSQTTSSGSKTAKRAVAAVAVLAAIGAGGAVVVHQNSATAAGGGAPVAAVTTAAPAATQAAPQPVPAPSISLPDFSVVAAHNGPAVVNINVTGSIKTAYDGGPQGRGDAFGDDPFMEFFRRFQGQQQPRGQREMPTHGMGSGFIISADGIILTLSLIHI